MPADSAGLLRKDSVSTNPSVPKSQRNAKFEEGDSCGVTGLDKGTDFLMILTGGTQALLRDFRDCHAPFLCVSQGISQMRTL